MRRTELIRRFVLESIANDYENLPQITKDVTGLGSLCGLTVSSSEILQALRHLVAAKLAKAYRLSNTAEEIDGMPPAAEMGSPHVSKLSDAFFWVTEAGKQVLLADYPDWPFDGNMVLRSDWNPPPG